MDVWYIPQGFSSPFLNTFSGKPQIYHHWVNYYFFKFYEYIFFSKICSYMCIYTCVCVCVCVYFTFQLNLYTWIFYDTSSLTWSSIFSSLFICCMLRTKCLCPLKFTLKSYPPTYWYYVVYLWGYYDMMRSWVEPSWWWVPL